MVFADATHRPDHGLDRGGVKVHAAHDHHVVGATEDTAVERERPRFLARQRDRPHQVAGAVTQERAGIAAERREDELTARARRRRVVGARLQHFAKIAVVHHAQQRGLPDGAMRHGADLRHAVVIDHTGTGPALRNARTNLGHAAAGLAGDHHAFDAGLREVNALLPCHVDEPQGVGGRATKQARTLRHQETQPLDTAHAARGNGAEAELLRRIKRRPEAEERSEGKCEEYRVTRARPGAAPDRLPVFEEPLPALGVVEPDDGSAARAAGLVETRVGLFRKCEGRAVGRVRGLVAGELVLRGERHAR